MLEDLVYFLKRIKPHGISNHLGDVLVDEDDGDVVARAEPLECLLDLLHSRPLVHDQVVRLTGLQIKNKQ